MNFPPSSPFYYALTIAWPSVVAPNDGHRQPPAIMPPFLPFASPPSHTLPALNVTSVGGQPLSSQPLFALPTSHPDSQTSIHPLTEPTPAPKHRRRTKPAPTVKHFPAPVQSKSATTSSVQSELATTPASVDDRITDIMRETFFTQQQPKTVFHSQQTAKKPNCLEEETDPKRFAHRDRQLAYGYNTKGNYAYSYHVPKIDRGNPVFIEHYKESHPQLWDDQKDSPFVNTPRREDKMSKREFDAAVSTWRRGLHRWDHLSLTEDQQNCPYGQKIKTDIENKIREKAPDLKWYADAANAEELPREFPFEEPDTD